MRLIDADELRTVQREIDSGCVGDFIQVLDEQPTVDAEPIIHGHWDEEGRCSNCGALIPTDDRRDYIPKDEVNYCYYCSAKMDKECEVNENE